MEWYTFIRTKTPPSIQLTLT